MTTEQKIIRAKVGLLELAKQLRRNFPVVAPLHLGALMSDADYGKLFGLSLAAVFVLILVLNAMALSVL